MTIAGLCPPLSVIRSGFSMTAVFVVRGAGNRGETSVVTTVKLGAQNGLDRLSQ